jgi:phosphoglucosamine mutase
MRRSHFSVGQAVAHLFKKADHRARVVIGKDTRISGYMLESSLEAGISSMGGISYLVRVLPTPGIAFITQSMRADAGIVISASHNPYQDNGIKIFAGNGFKLSDAQEETIESLILGGKLPEMVPQAREMGRSYRMEDAPGRYIVFLKNTFPRDLSMEGMKIVIDAANGATYRVGPAAFTELGAQVEVIHNNPSGLNINDNCGSQYTQDLQKRVVETGAASAWPSTATATASLRSMKKAHAITGDQILMICAKVLKDQGRLKKRPGCQHGHEQPGTDLCLQEVTGLSTMPPKWGTAMSWRTCSAWVRSSGAKSPAT